MQRESFNYRKFAALGAILALILVQGHASNAARSNASAVAASGVDLANEERVLARYLDDLAAYDKQTAELGKRASLVNADLDLLQRKSDDLKGRLSGVQNAIRDIVRKLKAANEWDDLDTTIAARITDARQKTSFQGTSFKQLLEESSNNLTGHANEISTPLENLRKRLTSRYGDGGEFQIVRAAHAPSPPRAIVGLKCRLGNVRIGLIHRLGGKPNNATLDTVSCACHPDKGSGVATGTACSAL